jgi:hypothetical protein
VTRSGNKEHPRGRSRALQLSWAQPRACGTRTAVLLDGEASERAGRAPANEPPFCTAA